MHNKFINFLKDNYSIIIVISIFSLLQLPVLDTSRPIMVDEAWYSNPSYNFITSCSFENTNIGYGGNGLIIFLFNISAYFYLFGVSLFSARLSSFVLGVISIFIVRKMLKILNASEFNKFISLSFFAFANLYLSIFKLARPEALAFVFSLCILLTTYYYLNKNYKIKFLFFIVFFSFLAINSHPNSSLIILLSFLTILYFLIKNKEYSKLYHLAFVIFGVAISMSVLIIMISLNNKVDLSASLSSLTQRNDNLASNLISKFNITTEYYITSNRIITFVPQFLLIITGLFYLKKNIYLFRLSLCGIISLCLAFIFLSPAGFIYGYPYVFIFSVFVLSMLLQTLETAKYLKKITIILVLAVIIFNIIAYISLTKKTYDSGINNKIKEISSLLPENSLIISESPFWYISPQRNIKSSRYIGEKKISLNGKDFYIINCDKFTKDFIADSNSIAYLNTYSENHNVDTIYTKASNIYGNIYLIKFTNK